MEPKNEARQQEGPLGVKRGHLVGTAVIIIGYASQSRLAILASANLSSLHTSKQLAGVVQGQIGRG